MVQADLLDRESLRAAFAGCLGVIHTASPMHDTPVSTLLRFEAAVPLPPLRLLLPRIE